MFPGFRDSGMIRQIAVHDPPLTSKRIALMHAWLISRAYTSRVACRLCAWRAWGWHSVAQGERASSMEQVV
jgi:hypothetical protein